MTDPIIKVVIWFWNEFPGPSQKPDIAILKSEKKFSHTIIALALAFVGVEEVKRDGKGMRVRKIYVETRFYTRNRLPLGQPTLLDMSH